MTDKEQAVAQAVMAYAEAREDSDWEWSVISNYWDLKEIAEELRTPFGGFIGFIPRKIITSKTAAIRHFARICAIRRGSDYGGKGSERW